MLVIEKIEIFYKERILQSGERNRPWLFVRVLWLQKLNWKNLLSRNLSTKQSLAVEKGKILLIIGKNFFLLQTVEEKRDAIVLVKRLSWKYCIETCCQKAKGNQQEIIIKQTAERKSFSMWTRLRYFNDSCTTWFSKMNFALDSWFQKAGGTFHFIFKAVLHKVCSLSYWPYGYLKRLPTIFKNKINGGQQ